MSNFQRLIHSLKVHWCFVVLLVLVTPLLLFRLPQSPVSWYDEGLNINAAQTLGLTGLYGLDTGNGIRLSDPAIQTGPPLIALISIVNTLSNNSLFAIRLTIVLISILTLISLYILAYRLYGIFAAILTVIMLIALPPTDTTSTFLMLSRQFLGEVPAVLFISLGCHLLLRTRAQFWTYLLVGICWGLAIVSKSQVLLVLSVTVALWSAYRVVTRKDDKYHWLVIGITMLSIYGVDTLWRGAMAGSMLADNMLVLREGIWIHILPFRAFENLQTFSIIIRFAASMGTLLLFFWLRRRIPKVSNQSMSVSGLRVENFIIIFVFLWMIWFALISIGWTRYSFIGIVFTILVLSGLLSTLWTTLKLPSNRYVMLVLMLATVIAAYSLNLNKLNDSQGDDFFSMVTEMKENIKPDARIVSMEWALDNFVPQRFIYPPTHIINVITENAILRPNEDSQFDSVAECPQFVLLGSFRLDLNVMRDALSISDPQPIVQHGIYKLYQVDSNQLPSTCAAKP